MVSTPLRTQELKLLDGCVFSWGILMYTSTIFIFFPPLSLLRSRHLEVKYYSYLFHNWRLRNNENVLLRLILVGFASATI